MAIDPFKITEAQKRASQNLDPFFITQEQKNTSQGIIPWISVNNPVAPLNPVQKNMWNVWGFITPLPRATGNEVTAPVWATYWEQNILSPNVTWYWFPTTTTSTTPNPITAPVSNIPAQSWETVGKQKDPTVVSNYLNTQPWFKTSIVGNTVVGTKNWVNTTWIYDGANWVTKPTIATGDSPVIGTPPATTPTTTTTDFTVMTPEQLKSRYMEIGTKLPWEITDEDRKFTRYLQTRMSLGETPDVIFGTKGTKSSGTTTYSTELVQPWENIASSTRNTDGTYNVVYKDWTSQTTTSEPSTTVFPEWTPEYFAQKQAQEAQKRLSVLETQLNDEAERRKKETADLVAKYGENIATQFQNQKAEIEANWAKRMDALNTGLSFSGFGRSTLALEKRDEIAKNIETTINQAKAKADLELMAYRMEREWADAEAISAMRTNIANVQTKIDDANYANQLKIIELNQQNATTGAEAMNNLLATISNADELMKDIDFEKSALHGYLVDKTTGKTMFDSQWRPIKFEDSASGLEPNEIQTFSELLKTGKVDIEWLKKLWLNPAEIADISKDYAIQNNTYVPTAQWSGEYTMAKIKWKTIKLDTVAMPSFQSAMAEMPENTVIGAQQFRTPEEQARLKAEWKSWTLDSNHMKWLAVDIYDGDPSRKPSAEQIAIMNKHWWYQDPALMAKGDYGHFDYKGVGGGGQTGTKPWLSPDTQQYIKNGTELKFIPKEDRQRVLTEMQLYWQSTPRTQEIEYNLELVDEILNNENLDKIVGNIQGRLPWMVLWWDVQYLLNQFNQIKNLITLDARQKLKGSGAISDFESKLLASSSSALWRNLDETAVRKELQKIKDAFSGKYKYYTWDINQYIAEQNATTGQSGTVDGEATVTNTNLIDSLR